MSNQSLEKTQGGGAAVQPAPVDNNHILVPARGALAPLTRGDLEFFAEVVQGAGLIPKEQGFSERQLVFRAMAKILAGHDYAMSPLKAMRSFDIINGKVVPTGECVAELIKKSQRYNFKVIVWNHQQCDLQFFERVGDRWISVGHSTFTIEDAQKAGLTEGANKHNWAKYTRNMLYWRALTNGKKLFCPEVMDTGGLLTNELPDSIAAPEYVDFDEPGQLAAGDTAGQLAEGAIDVTAEKAPEAEGSGLPFDGDPLVDLRIAVNDLLTQHFPDEEERAKFLKGRDPKRLQQTPLAKLHAELLEI